MFLCMDFLGKKINTICVENKKERIKSIIAKESLKLRVVESLELKVSDLGEYLRGKSEKIEEIRVSEALENTFHKIFIMPDLKKKMLNSAVETEVIKDFGNDYQYRYQDLGGVPGPGTKVNRKIMSVGLKRKSLEELSHTFAGFRVKPSSYTTYPVALQTLLDKLGLLSEKPLAFIELDRPSSRITVFKQKEIRLTRELPIAEEEKDPESSALIKDIFRTILFYNDTYPEERVTSLMFAGSSTTPEIEQNLSQKAGAEVIPFNPEPLFQGMEETSNIHPGCLGLALLNPDRLSFGFIPLSVQEKRQIKKTLTLSTTVFLGVVFIFALVVSRFSLDLRNLNVYHGGIKGEIKMKEDRLKELPLEFVSQSIETSQPPWCEILLELAAVVPPGVSLETFTLKNVKRVWRGEVTGVTDGSDEINSLLQVEEIQNNFVQSPLFKGAKLTERKLRGKRAAFKIIFQLDT